MNENLNPALFAYQKSGALWLASMQNAILGDEMRVGKTPTAIAGADLIRAKTVLVICPGIARINWEREFIKWQLKPRTTQCLMKSKQRFGDAQVVIVSYELLSERPVLVEILSRYWDLMIIDECHLVKNPAALRTQIIYGKDCDAQKGIAAHAKRVWLLSGTPIPNNIHEMWVHARALFPRAVRGLEKYQDWIDHFCYSVKGDFGTKIIDSRKDRLEDFVDRFAPYIKRRLLRDVQPDLPPLRFGMITVQPEKIPPRDEEIAETEMVITAALAKARNKPTEDEAELAALSAIDQTHISSLHKWTGIAKASAAAEYIAEEMKAGSRKVVIFAKHQEVFEILRKKLPGKGGVINGRTPQADRQPLIDAFQGKVAGNELDWLAVHIDIGSTAIDLTAARDCFFVESSWVPKDILQAAMRLMGINQKLPVMARLIALKGSLDEAIVDVVTRKYRSITKIESNFVS
jgi:SNF2 family DNA or RNA helicase